MPRLSTPPDMPRGVTTAIEILGNRVRARIVRQLATDGPSTAPQIAQAVGARREVVHQHLTQLEAAGLVTADEPHGHRHGRTVHWAVRPEKVADLVHELARYLAGD